MQEYSDPDIKVLNPSTDHTYDTSKDNLKPGRMASFRANKEQVYYSWTNVNFSVPLRKEDRQQIDHRERTKAYDTSREHTGSEIEAMSALDLKIEVAK